MRRYLLQLAAIFGIMAATFIATGYIQPYFDEETVITADRIKIVRSDGFFRRITYVRSLASGQERIKIIGAFPYRSARVTYDAICKCITEASLDNGEKAYSLAVYTDDDRVFFVDQKVETTSHGRIWLGWHMERDKAKPELAEAQALLDATRARFAGHIPKG